MSASAESFATSYSTQSDIYWWSHILSSVTRPLDHTTLMKDAAVMPTLDILLQWNKPFPSLLTKEIIYITRPRTASQFPVWVTASSGLRSSTRCICFFSDCSFWLACNNIEMYLCPQHPYKVGNTISPLYRWEMRTRSQRFNSNWNDCIKTVERQETNSSFHTGWVWSALHSSDLPWDLPGLAHQWCEKRGR